MKKMGYLVGSLTLAGTILAGSVSKAASDYFDGSYGQQNPASSFLGSAQAAEIIPPRPTEYNVSFDELDFDAKPWIKDFKFVVVVNRAERGSDSQTIRVYREGKLITSSDVQRYLQDVNRYETDVKALEERSNRISELPSLTKNGSDTVFKVSTGRNQFEKKGENHSQKDSWTTTPTGYYTIQYTAKKHKSEAYSAKMCDSIFGKVLGFITQKEMCTNIEYVMFFNGGIALHKAIPGTEEKLGRKASGGCVRLPAALAEYLYRYAGSDKGYKAVPVVNPDGTAKTDADGNVVYSETTNSVWGSTQAWSTLVIVQDQVK